MPEREDQRKWATRGTRRVPLNDRYARLGEALRRVREAAGRTTRDIQKPDGSFYGSGSISNVEGGYSAPSVELIKAYARLGGSYADLMTLRDKAQKPARQDTAEADEFESQLLDPRTNPYLLRRGYVMDLQEDTCYINANRVPTRNIYKVAVRPLLPTSRYFVLRYGHGEDPNRGVASIQAGSGCEVVLVDEEADGTIFAVLQFDQDRMDEFGRCNFSYSIAINSMIPSKPMYDLYTKSLMLHVVHRIQFEAPAVPEKIWWFRGTDPFRDRLEPATNQLLEVNPFHFYFHEFYDVEAEGCGMAWRWGA